MLRASATPIGFAEAVSLLRRLPRVERWGCLEAVHGASMTVAGFGSRIAVGDRVLVQGQGPRFARRSGRVCQWTGHCHAGRSRRGPGARRARVALRCPIPLSVPSLAWPGDQRSRAAARWQRGSAPWRSADAAAVCRAGGIWPPSDGSAAGDRHPCTGCVRAGVSRPAAGRVRCIRRRQVDADGDACALLAADVVVVGLIGERGREVREFLDVTLG